MLVAEITVKMTVSTPALKKKLNQFYDQVSREVIVIEDCPGG